ncbi:MAG: hypothetical protein N0C90_19160 [Candidatus Thiodiazotropha endolucinida]|nr:hypothetical protein [Candidatus Thiodiazotropha taylori]MCW4263474.1 hypothetical protein [Candidatus Thiodiazotropha endolucinida]
MSSHLKKRHSLPQAVVQAKTTGASENHCASADYRRRGVLNKVGPTKCPEPTVAGLPTEANQPTEVASVDVLSLHPRDDERLSLLDETISGDVGAVQDLSDISSIELDDAEAEDMLDKFARAYDAAFPEQQRVEHEDVSPAPTTNTGSTEDGPGSTADS